VTGTLDPVTTPALRDALEEAVRDVNRHLVIDLSAVRSLDSTALHALFAARHLHDMSGGGHLVAVIDPDSGAIPELYLVALGKAFKLHNNLAGALDACGRRPIDTALSVGKG
jgi:anti-anti-sigma factor